MIVVMLCHAPLHTFAAQAVKGEACSAYKERRRARCPHTLIVAIVARIGQNSTAASSTGEGGAAGASSNDPELPRTPRVLLDSDAGFYDSKMQDTLVYMSRLKFPSTFPSGLGQVVGTAGTRFTVSQTRCTCWGELLPDGDVDAKLVTAVSACSTVTRFPPENSLFTMNLKQSASCSQP